MSASCELNSVAPLAGAWIEIIYNAFFMSRVASLPSRERGLKFYFPGNNTTRYYVAPLAGAWIEI